MVAIPVSSFVGSPISAALLETDGWLGLRGWQWMFIIEAVPAVLQDRGDSFDDEHPLPSTEAKPSVGFKECCRDRRADKARNRNGDHEQTADPSAVVGGKPISELQNHAGEESCFSSPEQKPHQIE